ncbi:Hypothetical protein PHPALM_5881 [Phytophthora palmivora]|uniref:Uncharacterized protein n=1 Tax=Phytophthora palmivora TaxID=4796 RepID=A0A2P4YGJ8_9STRA|nr:Hypothetical protein PHPALM_5881 [Phytophthora palmivora]
MLKNEFISDAKSLFMRELRMDLSVDDCDAHDFQYFQDVTHTEEKNGLQGLIGVSDPTSPGHQDRMRIRCQVLVENVQPALLKEKIQSSWSSRDVTVELMTSRCMA